MSYKLHNLREILEEHKKIEEKTVREITKDILKGLQYLHYQRFIHCDIKPESILLDSEGKAFIGGLATVRMKDINLQISPKHEIALYYIAPELTYENPKYDFPCDIYALGCMLFELLTGEVPFISKTIVELTLKKREGKINWVNYSPEFVSFYWKDFLMGLLKVDPKERFTWKIISDTFDILNQKKL